MANYLTLKLPKSTITIESDNDSSIEKLFDFCITELEGYHSTEDHHELTVDTITKEQLTRLYSLCKELGFF